VLALDSRFITGLSDGDSVATWEDRTNNNYDVTQSSSGSRPLFKAAQSGGSSVVRFDGSNDRLLRSDTGFPTGDFTTIVVAKETRTLSGGQYGAVFHYGAASIGASVFVLFGDDSNIGDDSFGASQFGDAFGVANSTGRYIIGRISRTSTSYDARVDGGSSSSKTMTTSTSLRGADGFSIGAYNPGVGGGNLNGDVGVIAIFSSALSSPLSRRVEHAAAFSFKIACQ
jgi:hypothetical protein